MTASPAAWPLSRPTPRVIHVDIDPAEIGKNRAADLPIVGDCKRVIARINEVLKELKPTEAEANATDRNALVGSDPRVAETAPLQRAGLRPLRSSRSTS